MTRLTLAAALAAATLVPAATTAQPMQNCAERDKVLARLDKGFGETLQSIGLAPNNMLIEVFASDETGTWTITATTAAGLTCILAAGQAFESTSTGLTPVKGELL